VPAVLAPSSSSSTTTPGSSGGGGGGLSAETKLRLVVGGLVVVGGGIAALTLLYWRRTRPPAVNTALDALGDLDPLAASIVTVPIGPVSPPPIAPTAVPGSPSLPASWLDLAAATPAAAEATTAAAAGAGTGVRILGPVAASVARAEGATPVDPDTGPDESDASSLPQRTAPTIEPPPLTIVTLEDLQNRVKTEPAPAPELFPEADPPGYGGDHD